MRVKALGQALRPPAWSTPKYTYICQQRLRSTNRPAVAESQKTQLNARWLGDLKQRLGKCLTFGLQPEQTQEAGKTLEIIARDWRELLAGSEGYLTDRHRRGLFRHKVVWGESDSMVRTLHSLCHSECMLKLGQAG